MLIASTQAQYAQAAIDLYHISYDLSVALYPTLWALVVVRKIMFV